MLTSLALVFLLALLLKKIAEKAKLPALVGMLIAGIILGPSLLNALDSKLLDISAEIRKIALVIILTRAGLALDLKDLKKVGRPAILMSFVPATIEITAITIFAPILLHISTIDAAIMGAVVAAVSPAVIVPKMIQLMDEKYGTKEGVPQMIMASASIDDIFVIVLFTSFLGLAQGKAFSFISLINVPIAVFSGAVFGFISGKILAFSYNKIQSKDAIKVVILLSTSFLFLELEHLLEPYIAFSGLIAIMCSGISIRKYAKIPAEKIAAKFFDLWQGAEILLFALVGAAVNLDFAIAAGPMTIALIFLALAFRMSGVFISLLKSKFNKKERIFCMIAYSPKATVQAAIGSIPLSMGLSCGNIVLTVAVLAILITAPLGAFGIELTYRKFLAKS